MISRLWKALLLLLLGLTLVGCAAGRPWTCTKPMDLNAKVKAGMVQKVEAFEVILDASQTMNEYVNSYQRKIMIARDRVSLMNQTIPDIKLQAALRTYGEADFPVWVETQRIYGVSPWVKPDFEDSFRWVAPGAESPLALALDGAAEDMKQMKGRLALIVFTDGKEIPSPGVLASVKKMKQSYGSRLCISTVLVGADAAGGKLLEQVYNEGGACGVQTTADRIGTADGMADFVERVFFGMVVAEKAIEKAAAVPMTDASLVTVLFDFDKSAVKSKYNKDLEKVADLLKKNPALKIRIEGNTDSIGTEAYNQRLSERRAAAVKAYLAEKLKVDAGRIETVGYGKDKPVADNQTKQGRQKNRRAVALRLQ
ncbi:MAG TPA: OmpA family protein [Syntrophales bacterium]|nr:OmpA family protein [Syntrophales bacterium]